MKITFIAEDEDGDTKLSLEYDDDIAWTTQVKLFKSWLDAQGYIFSKEAQWLFDQLEHGSIDEKIWKLVGGK